MHPTGQGWVQALGQSFTDDQSSGQQRIFQVTLQSLRREKSENVKYKISKGCLLKVEGDVGKSFNSWTLFGVENLQQNFYMGWEI